MAAVMAAGMVPLIGMAIATFLARNKFTSANVMQVKPLCFRLLCFISEGATVCSLRSNQSNHL